MRKAANKMKIKVATNKLKRYISGAKSQSKEEIAMAKVTIGERRFQLTEMVKSARNDFINIENVVRREVRKANPGLKENDWVAFYKKVEDDPRVQVAQARLLALCDAANVMGAEID